jgi:hypothetical protein
MLVNDTRQKIALNAIWIADTYLDVVLLCETSIGIERLTLPKYATNRIL